MLNLQKIFCFLLLNGYIILFIVQTVLCNYNYVGQYLFVNGGPVKIILTGFIECTVYPPSQRYLGEFSNFFISDHYFNFTPILLSGFIYIRTCSISTYTHPYVERKENIKKWTYSILQIRIYSSLQLTDK